MKKIFYIKYEVDTGYEYLNDEAIVVAENEEEAVKLLKEAIGKLGHDYCVNEVSSIKEFTGNVFTKHYGFKHWF